jgi:hypothetical protein
MLIYSFITKQTESDSTKVAILAGTESSLYVNAPYIQSKVNTLKWNRFTSSKPSNGAINLK